MPEISDHLRGPWRAVLAHDRWAIPDLDELNPEDEVSISIRRGTALLDATATEGDAMALYDEWPLRNVWLGTSIELDRYARRADDLRRTSSAVRLISAEPLLGPLPSLDLTGIDQLIIGGESGPRSRPMDLGWVRELIAMARDAGTAVFVKQLGARWAQDHYRGGQPVYRVDHKGGNWDFWDADLRIREWPAVDAEAATS